LFFRSTASNFSKIDTGSSRWYQRKRRNRANQQEARVEHSTEHQESFTPLRQGRVSASTDND